MPKDPRRTPTQRRSRETVAVILEAAARILASDGADALSTNHIAEVAGVSVGSLYQYFPDRDSLVAALVDDRLARDAAAIAGALGEIGALPPDAQWEAFVGFVLDHQRAAAPWLARLLPLLPALDREGSARAMVDGSVTFTAAFLLEQPERLRPELRDPARLHRVLGALAHGLRGFANTAAGEDPERLADPDIRAAFVRMARAALLDG